MIDEVKLQELFRMNTALFVRAAYLEILHRSPDDAEFAQSMDKLAEGKSREEFLFDLRISPEGIMKKEPFKGFHIRSISVDRFLALEGEALVDASYLAILGRDPEPEGKENHLKALRDGLSKEQLLTIMQETEEGRRFDTVITGLRKYVRRQRLIRRISSIRGGTRLIRLLRAVWNVSKRAGQKILGQSLIVRVRNYISNLLHINRLAMRIYNLENLAGTMSLTVNPIQNSKVPEEIERLQSDLSFLRYQQQEQSRIHTGFNYRIFEDAMRGSREEIKKRLHEYDTVIETVRRHNGDDLFALDLGCGRGEWLELLDEKGITALGVDNDISMLENCQERNLMMVQGDILAYLQQCQSASVDLVTFFQVVEHLPIGVLNRALKECHRILRPGGALIAETPNPESLLVGACNFYIDPTHQKPIPPPLLQALIEDAGLKWPEVRRIHPYPGLQTPSEAEDSALSKEMSAFFNHAGDYAVIAWKS